MNIWTESIIFSFWRCSADKLFLYADRCTEKTNKDVSTKELNVFVKQFQDMHLARLSQAHVDIVLQS